MQDVRVRLSTAIAIAVLGSAGAYAAGRSTSNTVIVHEPAPPPVTNDLGGSAHEGDAPPAMTETTLPPGHPAVDPGAAPPSAPPQDTTLTWKVPARWQTAANPSSMRIATYRIPHAPGDASDADVSVTQAGGTVEANADRWIGQFGADAKKTAKQTTRTVGGLEVTVVEVEGTYSGGMTADTAPAGKAALLGAIVATPGMPHFFKITGPAKTVQSARAELDALLASLSTKS